ncbi:MAG: hypothetical protein AB7W16_17000 [Candidatus Obscuribacterales bacterium]
MFFRIFFSLLILLSTSFFFSPAKSKSDSSKLVVPDRDLIGTRWTLTPSEGSPFEIEFEKDHDLLVRHLRLGRGAKPSWFLRGNKIELIFNNGYAIYKGRFVSKKKIKGTARNHHSESWLWTANRL